MQKVYTLAGDHEKAEEMVSIAKKIVRYALFLLPLAPSPLLALYDFFRCTYGTLAISKRHKKKKKNLSKLNLLKNKILKLN